MSSKAGMTLVFAAFCLPAAAATVDVRITNVTPGKGKINVAVCDRERFLKQCAYSASVPANANAQGEVVARVQGVPAGTWAVLAYQDENSNDELDRHIIGLPKENYGFSRDARGRFGPPGFDDAAITVAEPTTAATVRLH